MRFLRLYALQLGILFAEVHCERRKWLWCRGGSSGYPPAPGYSASGFENYPPPDLPPDLPAFDDDPFNNLSQEGQQQQQSNQHQPPPFPPNYGDMGSAPPLPAGYQQSMLQEPEPDPFPDEPEAKFGDVSNDGMDLSAFDKDYILKGLARLYRKKILPLEISSRYGHFHSPPLSPADFVAQPMVLLLGQYRYDALMLHVTNFQMIVSQ